MLSSVVLTAMAAGGLMSLLLGPLGCFVVWRQMAYFGDAIAHAALLGVALALVMNLPFTPAIFIVAVGVAATLTYWMRDTRFHADTLLGFLAHGTLALGLLIVALSGHTQIDINAFLFGDILTLSQSDLITVGVLVVVGLGILLTHWRGLVLATLEPNLAAVEGYQVMKLNYLLVAVLAGTIAVAIKLVGVLLITALLIMPAAAARPLSRTPAGMAKLAALMSMLAIGLGIAIALPLDAPTGPMIVVVAMVLCITTLAIDKLRA
jgi:zinc transport system permease protein